MTYHDFHYFYAEQNWRFDNLFRQIDDILEEIFDIRLSILLLDESPSPPREFDPFETIGKY
jgi:hypothetical protein